MRQIFVVLALLFSQIGAVVYVRAASTPAGGDTAVISGLKLPSGYRDWRLISVAHEAGKLNDIRAILGNDAAFNAFRDGKRPFPDGAIVARVAWKYEPLAESKEVFGQAQSFIAGPPTNVQLMIRDSHRYASTAGWGFAQFNTGNPNNVAQFKTCYSCHEAAAGRDFIFNRYAP